jgi:hypothetical protein
VTHPLASGQDGTKKVDGRMLMLQFETFEWIEIRSQLASDDRRKQMEPNLASDRKEHTETETLWQKVAKAAAAEASYQPPPQKVRAVKSAFTMNGPASKRRETGGILQLLYDSFLQPALAGVRSGSMRIRQMLYRADPYQIDFQVELEPEQNRIVVTGQLLDLSHPEMVGRDVEVTISDGRDSVANTMTNQFGEFRGEVKNSGNLEITLVGRTEKPISILLRGPLDPLADAKA